MYWHRRSACGIETPIRQQFRCSQKVGRVRSDRRAKVWSVKHDLPAGAAAFLTAVLLSGPCFATTFGIVALSPVGKSRLYSPRALSSAETVYFQYAAVSGETRCCLRQRAATFERDASSVAAIDGVTGAAAFAYRFVPTLSSPPRPFAGIAVIGTNVGVSQRRDSSLRAESAAGAFSASSCTSAEGIHVYVATGARNVSDLYLGFDYPIESPSCPEVGER